jgi:nucleoid DNA-binding protein
MIRHTTRYIHPTIRHSPGFAGFGRFKLDHRRAGFGRFELDHRRAWLKLGFELDHRRA